MNEESNVTTTRSPRNDQVWADQDTFTATKFATCSRDPAGFPFASVKVRSAATDIGPGARDASGRRAIRRSPPPGATARRYQMYRRPDVAIQGAEAFTIETPSGIVTLIHTSAARPAPVFVY